ncbi:glycosyltransferase family 2 protein [Mesorhizobium sp. ES1-1]|uniref:glycosyltransferase family 2 protein n=1 Tax=Mesorhizobium sp. ES1-1 TaxID=2876629 RepID=UPI001CCDA041|nr:glycosyltransferase family A protein [Mesorhizobium sp. ES1-1]MBZ9677691.1 glycosyltransferase family 2 protein [Mesorhizobium sp. ES1-1]
MKIVVVIATFGRPEHVTRLLAQLEKQTRLPDAVIISAPDAGHIPSSTASTFPVSTLLGKTGLPAQRNIALEAALDRFDIVTFFDDDFIPEDTYLAGVSAAFDKQPDWAVITGNVLRDGASSAGLTWDEGIQALAEANPTAEAPGVDKLCGYGCNMAIRTAFIGNLRFDERLVLYGWQEDVDFTSQLRVKGRVVGLNSIRGVHLGVKSGRVSGVRFGYSQVANPVYLIRKGTVPLTFALRLVGKNLLANLARSLWPESYVDRRGRLRGNLLAISHVVRGRVEPEYILEI